MSNENFPGMGFYSLNVGAGKQVTGEVCKER